MTIEADRASFWLRCAGSLAALSLIVYGCAGSNKLRHGDSVDVSSYPQDIQSAYAVFAVRCSRCHTLARPLNARIHDAQHWVRYVARMRLNPSSGINAKNADVILHFLLYYMHQQAKDDEEADEPPSVPSTNATEPPGAGTKTDPAHGSIAPDSESHVEPGQPSSAVTLPSDPLPSDSPETSP
jgi:hypothetical protein